MTDRGQSLLRKALIQIDFSGSFDEVIHQFEDYRQLLLKWNRKMNLVSKGDIEDIVTKHFLPSIGWIQKINVPDGSRVMDVGSGAGFPGIPLKLIRPDLHMTLVESKRKKVLFLRQAAVKLGLQSIEVINARVESLGRKAHSIDIVICRAVTDLVTMIGWIKQFMVIKGGKLIALKGRDVKVEVEDLEGMRERYKIKRIEILDYCPFPTIVTLKKGYLVVVSF